MINDWKGWRIMEQIKKGDISLRLFQFEDIPLKVEWINDNDNNQYLHYDIPISIKETEEWFYKRADNRLDCIIEYGGNPVGVIGLTL